MADRWFVPAAVRASVAGLPRSFWWLWWSTLINRVGTFVFPFLTLYLILDRGYSATTAGLVVSSFGLGSVIGTLIGGECADRYGRRVTIGLSYVGSSVLTIGLGEVSGFGAIALFAALLGAASAAPRPAISAMVVDLVPAEDRQRAFSLNYWAVNIGFSLSTLLAGFLIEVSFAWVFIGDAATTLACGLLAWITLEETRVLGDRGRAIIDVDAAPARTFGRFRVLRDRRFMALTSLTFILWLLFYQAVSTLPVVMKSHGLPPSDYGLVFSLNGVLVVALQLPLGRVLQGRPYGRLMAGAAVLFGGGFGLTAFAGASALYYGFTVIIWTLGEMVYIPTSSAVVAELSPVEMRGRYQGVYGMGTAAASFVAPLGGGLVLDHSGAAMLWGVCAILGLLAAISFIFLGFKGSATRSLSGDAVAGEPRVAGSTDRDSTELIVA